MQFTADRAFEAGAKAEQVKGTTKGAMKEKIAKSNAFRAAKAELTKQGAEPPSTQKSAPDPSLAGGPSIEKYIALKKEKKFDEAQQVADALARLP